MTGGGGLISVRADVAASLLIDGLYEAAVARSIGAAWPGPIAVFCERQPDPAAARLGYLSRLIERERFPVAGTEMPWLVERLGAAAGDADAVALALAREEPLEKPAPADGAPSWRVPGPGGHVRHFLAVRAADKRSWLAGFFRACCEEVGPRRRAAPPSG